jgi:hypothetical protein
MSSCLYSVESPEKWCFQPIFHFFQLWLQIFYNALKLTLGGSDNIAKYFFPMHYRMCGIINSQQTSCIIAYNISSVVSELQKYVCNIKKI